jgi:hypothetical protein
MNTDEKRGRPSDYTQEIALEICQRLSDGESLRKICRDDRMPVESAVRMWALQDRDGFYAQYTMARSIGYERLADDLLEIADEGKNDTYMGEDGVERTDMDVIARSRIRIDTRKWMLSKMLPKVYGDKLTQELTGKDGAPLLTGIEVTFVKTTG